MGEVAQQESGGKKGGKPKGKKMSTHIDMTPMVDLAFLLLTFFMLATSFSKPKTMEIIMPNKIKDKETEAPEINKEKVLNVVLGPDDKLFYYVGLEPEKMEQIQYGKPFRDLLYQRKRIEGSMVLIKAADDARYANIVTLFDEMNITEQERYALVDIVDRETEALKEKLNGTATGE